MKLAYGETSFETGETIAEAKVIASGRDMRQALWSLAEALEARAEAIREQLKKDLL